MLTIVASVAAGIVIGLVIAALVVEWLLRGFTFRPFR